MIDTDKYEGHTEGPWRIVRPHHANETGHIWCIESDGVVDYALHHPTRIAHICVIDNEDDDSINAQLIADAPKLLAEVKRLREEVNTLNEMKFTKRQLKLIWYCLEGEYSNVDSSDDYPWHIWSHLGYGDRDEAVGKIEGGSTPLHKPHEVVLKDLQALAELQEAMDIVKRMVEEE